MSPKKTAWFTFLIFLVPAGFAGIYFIVNVGYEWIPEAALKPARQADLLEYPKPDRCAECHRDIFEAWKKSRHSLSWVSENYIHDSENRSKEKCLPCHVPEKVIPGNKPEPRSINRDSGIYCVPCHVRDAAMHGPYDLLAPPHPTRKDASQTTSKFCGSCHEKTLKEWLASASEKTCQECHMPRTRKRLTQKFPLSFLHAKKQVGDHSFPHGEIGENDLKMQTEWTGNRLTVTLTNTAIPHNVPTADNGDPRLYLYVNTLSASGAVVEENKEIIAPQQETALAYHKESRFTYIVPEPAADILLQYKPAWSKEKSDVRRMRIAR